MARNKLTIISALFQILEVPLVSEWNMRISVVARNIQHIALPFVARIGEQPVRGLVVYPAGDGFEGFLERTPEVGDRLYVGYDVANIQTNVVFGEEAPQPAVV